MMDSAGKPMRTAMAPWLDVDCAGSHRFEALLLPALGQALAPLAALTPPLRVALALTLPSVRPGLPTDVEAVLRAGIARRFAGAFSAIAVFPAGHAGGFIAMEAASRRISADTFDACVIAGVDSYLEPETLEWLELSDQLHGAGPRNNAWGFIPGEGAGAVLMVSDAACRRFALEPLASLLSVGTAVERNRIKTKTVCIGEGLTEALRAGLAGLPGGALVSDVYCDMNGEPYRADEFGFAVLRVKESFVSASSFVAPADCWGDVAAASAPLAMILATAAGRKAYANGTLACLWASSETGERGGALLHVSRPERE